MNLAITDNWYSWKNRIKMYLVLCARVVYYDNALAQYIETNNNIVTVKVTEGTGEALVITTLSISVLLPLYTSLKNK